LKDRAAAVSDGFPPNFYKKSIVSITKPLCIFFNRIIQFGAIPCSWKTANITPIFKKGSSTDPGNYRPISITVVCCKIFESAIKKHLISFLDENAILNPAQHGFLAKHSTCSNLIEALNDWSDNLDNRSGSLIAYIDFSKALTASQYQNYSIVLKIWGSAVAFCRVLNLS
jgi:hypothetical protein